MRLFLLLCDPCRIQTCNPHIRSVVLYSVELMDPEVSPLIGETGLRRKGHIPLVFEKKRGISLLAVRTRLELATYGVTGRYSNQLNYRTK